ncbi:MAG: chromosomal replication initiator protein DnaA [Chloroflexi bacterium]|nr:chromosomal replication initiator protein DnaA [Chloroflexota bacterium]MBP8055722.1 chromosomal replication initiator protein DnaA [Chloroflexota bacterium]
MLSPTAAWKATLGELELQMTKATFNTWLKDTRLLTCDGDTYVIGVRNDYAKDWLENRLQDTILRTLVAITDRPVLLRFMVGGDELASPVASLNGKNGGTNGNGVAAHTTEVPAGNRTDGLNSRYSFATFIVGDSNRLAHAAALAVAEKPGKTYNPLFIYGGVGLGKTHLMHAIGHKCAQAGYNICYVSSETFTNDLVQSIRTQKMAEFREKYRTPDLLLIDDVQFVAGKESTQEELFHTFNDLHGQGKQVVLSSDRPPKAMSTLEERLKSRFEWGLMADIQMPNVETRKAILQAKAEENRVTVPETVLDLIAHRFRNNIRELEGALNKVVAYSQLAGTPIDMQLVTMALADLSSVPQHVSLAQVVQVVIDHYGVTLDEMRDSTRAKRVSFPRQVAMYLARTETDESFPTIGDYLGGRDHTTILYGYEKVAELLETDSEVRRDVMAIKSALYAVS